MKYDESKFLIKNELLILLRVDINKIIKIEAFHLMLKYWKIIDSMNLSFCLIDVILYI